MTTYILIVFMWYRGFGFTAEFDNLATCSLAKSQVLESGITKDSTVLCVLK